MPVFAACLFVVCVGALVGWCIWDSYMDHKRWREHPD